MSKITILCASPRSNSNSLKVSKGLKRVFNEKGFNQVHIVDFKDYDIPFLNQGKVDLNSLTPFQADLINNWSEANLVLIVCPEYNWFPTAEIINLLHQVGDTPFKHLFDNRIFSFVGVSSGRGGRIPTIQLAYVINKLINVLNTHAITAPKSFEVQFAPKVLDADGLSLGNEEFDKGMNLFIEHTIKLMGRYR